MSHHDFNGDYVALHSVCVSKDHQRKGIASALLKEYIARLKNSPDPLKGILLIAHEELVKLYQSVGFELVGKSDVQHGSRPWYEMKIDFDVPSTSSAGRRNPGKRRAHFGVIENLIGQDGLNSADVYCPRAQCRCLLLKRKTGRFVKSSSTDQVRATLMDCCCCRNLTCRLTANASIACRSSRTRDGRLLVHLFATRL